MRNNVVLMITALFIFGASISSVANEDPRNSQFAVVQVKGSEVFKVIYKTEVANRVKLNIYNASSRLIFSETLNGDGFIRPLNFAGLTAGEYTIEITDGANKRSEKITYQPVKGSTSISGKVVHISKVDNGGKFIVSIARAASEEVTVNIYDNFNNLVHSESKEISGEFAQIYHVKNSKVSAIEVIDASGNKKVSRF